MLPLFRLFRDVGLEQYAIKAFAEALEVVPHTLAENSGMRTKELVSKLYAAHQAGDKNIGLDNESEGVAVKDVAEAKILDHFSTKRWGLVYATRAACTVLRVDQVTSPATIQLPHRVLFCLSLILTLTLFTLLTDHHGKEGGRTEGP